MPASRLPVIDRFARLLGDRLPRGIWWERVDQAG